MADFRDQYGNPVHQTDEYGNPIHHGAGTMGSYGMPTQGHGAQGAGYDHTVEHGHGVGTGTGVGPAVGGYGAGGHGMGTGVGPAVGGYGDQQQLHHQQQQQHGVTGMLHRSGSSSSSSEDDGEGGRRRKKKGIKDKIMEKLPGGDKDRHQEHTTAGATGYPEGYYGTQQQQHPDTHEKKGFMDKIKDKLPGTH